VPIKEGEMFLLPGNIPHSPIRGANTVGLVIEKVRKGTDMVDGLMWFCDSCNHLLHEYKFELVDIENDFQSRFKDFYSDVAKRTCSKCGTIMEIDERFA
jgi:3-hydroxyanthranilate 3,4-dioxygenase